MKSLTEFIKESIQGCATGEILFKGSIKDMSTFNLPEMYNNIDLLYTFGTIILYNYPSKNVTDIYYTLEFKFGKVRVTYYNKRNIMQTGWLSLKKWIESVSFSDFVKNAQQAIPNLYKQIAKSCSYITVHTNLDSESEIQQFIKDAGIDYQSAVVPKTPNDYSILIRTYMFYEFMQQIPEYIVIQTTLNNNNKLKLAISREPQFYMGHLNNNNATASIKKSKSVKPIKSPNLKWNDINGINEFLRNYIKADRNSISIDIDNISDANSKLTKFRVYKDKNYKPDFSIYWAGDSTDGHETVDVTQKVINHGIYIPEEHDDYYDDDVDRVKHYEINYSASDIRQALQQVIDKINSGKLSV